MQLLGGKSPLLWCIGGGEYVGVVSWLLGALGVGRKGSLRENLSTAVIMSDYMSETERKEWENMVARVVTASPGINGTLQQDVEAEKTADEVGDFKNVSLVDKAPV